jgi:hypothetical protein
MNRYKETMDINLAYFSNPHRTKKYGEWLSGY